MKSLFIAMLSLAGVVVFCCITMYVAGIIFGIYKQFKNKK